MLVKFNLWTLTRVRARAHTHTHTHIYMKHFFNKSYIKKKRRG